MHPFFEESSAWPFLILTAAFGGWCARIVGRSLASGWRPAYLLPLALLPLVFGIRFLHYALYEATLLSMQYFLADYSICACFAAWGYLTRRSELMSRLYPFLFRRYGLIAWKDRRREN